LNALRRRQQEEETERYIKSKRKHRKKVSKMPIEREINKRRKIKKEREKEMCLQRP
jgi:hypothetical protein